MTRKVDEASNFVFVQLIDQEPGIDDKCQAVYARKDKTILAGERIFH
jgi:predicted nucleic acid-binding protein